MPVVPAEWHSGRNPSTTQSGLERPGVDAGRSVDDAFAASRRPRQEISANWVSVA
ncbi:MAG: hypothetical protein ABSC73_07375 [Acidimicrobiales bacterium]